MNAFARESFFKVLSEKDFNTGVFQQILGVFQNTFLIENIWPTAPEINYLNLELFLISKPYYTTTAHTILNSKTKYGYSVFFTGISYYNCPSPMFSKICTFLYFYILSHLLSFWNPSPPLSPPPPSLHTFFPILRITFSTKLTRIITSKKSSILHFQQHFLEHVHTISHFFSVCIFHTISNEHWNLQQCNIIVSSLVLHLCQLFTFTYNMRYCFTFL